MLKTVLKIKAILTRKDLNHEGIFGNSVIGKMDTNTVTSFSQRCVSASVHTVWQGGDFHWNPVIMTFGVGYFDFNFTGSSICKTKVLIANNRAWWM